MGRELTSYDLTRYVRQIAIEGWGESGQLKLKSASVFIAGAGGLGSPVALYLAAAGVGRLVLCDSDAVELSNLNRQIMHADERIGEQKALSAGRTLRTLNPSIEVVTLAEYLSAESVERLVGVPDIVVDCLDTFATRHILNAYCVRARVPLVHAGVMGLMGQVTFIDSPHTPCLACMIPVDQPTESGPTPVSGPAPGIIGSIQALEVLKYLTGIGDTLRGRLLIMDGLDMRFDAIDVDKNPECPICGSPSLG